MHPPTLRFPVNIIAGQCLLLTIVPCTGYVKKVLS